MNTNKKYESLHDFLDALMEDKETECVEFKHGKGGFPVKGVKETYSSFANTEGGVIVVGIKEKNGNFYPEGLSKDIIREYEKVFWDAMNDPGQVSRNILTNDDVEIDEYNRNYFMLISVPRASREERPIFIGQNPLRGTYRRNASGDYLCKEWEVAIMLAEQRPKLAMDTEILEGFSMDDIDKESLRGFRQLFITLKPTHPWTEDDDISFLKHMKAYAKDRVTGKEGLTLAGLLMFGKYDSLTDAIPQFMIDYREYAYGSERWIDRIFNDGTWEGNLYQAYRRILPRIQSFLSVPFQLKGNERQDETKAHKALREAFVNLCVHASYQSDSKLLVLKYPDRIVFSNPGTLLVSKEQFFNGGESICRNPSLQTMFSLIGAVEKAGSGADTIVQGWHEAKFDTPVIIERSEPNKVELTLPITTITGNGDSNGDSNGYSNGDSNGYSKGYSNGDSNVLLIVKDKISKGLKVSYKESSQAIVELCKDWRSAQEIALALGYSASHVKNKLIPRMISDGIIEQYDKRSTTSPEQKYRVK